MKSRLAPTLLLFLAVAAPGAYARMDAGGSPVPASEAPREIAALLSLLRVSPCRFERNGRWYDAERAAAHLQGKLDHAIARGKAIGSTELFIDHAASASSVTGRIYQVQCGDDAKVPARAWFHGKLAELRRTKS